MPKMDLVGRAQGFLRPTHSLLILNPRDTESGIKLPPFKFSAISQEPDDLQISNLAQLQINTYAIF